MRFLFFLMVSMDLSFFSLLLKKQINLPELSAAENAY